MTDHPAEGKPLLPCPFCGGKAAIEQHGTMRQSCIIACEDCSCRLETGEVFDMGRAWNTRHSQGANATTPSPAVSAIELAYGLLWCMSVNRRAPNGWLASEARKALLAQLDKDGQARGIMAARAAFSREERP